MDGDGEELVAIVQSLDSPGVTVTVSSRSRHDVERRRSSRARIHINTVNRSKVSPAADHSVDTMPATPGEQSASVSRRASVNTNTGADFAKLSKGSQICDDRYTSSYKLAHCQVTPSSPPEAVSEFPLQRREPCRNEGNFEISRNRSAQSSFHIEQGSGQSFSQPSRNGQVKTSTSRIRQNGGSLIWRDKGSSHRYCNPKRDFDAFEKSLRKYPSMGPLRSASHDLIEKLIRYTQAKNFQEMSRSSKSMRSLRHQKSADAKDLQSKHQQTYIRRQDNNLPSSSGVQVGHVGRTKNFKLYSPTSDSRNIRNRETAFSTSYDYLNAGSPPDGRSNRSDGSPSPTGSRSPEDLRSPDRSSVRFGSPVGSKGPGIPSRSERPIRFERSVRDLSLSEMSKYIRNTVRQICNEKPLVFQMCPKLKDRYDQHKRTCPSKNEQTSDVVDTGCQCKRSDCHCARATQCAYDSDVPTKTVGCSCRTRTIEAKTSCQRDLACVCTRKAEELAYYYKKIDEAISIWLKDVPVHNIECTANKRKRETAIKRLRQILKQLPDDEDFDENVRNEVSCFVDEFPLWTPSKDEDEESLFKNQLVEKLIDTILAIPRKPDRFREIVTKWVENLDFEDDDEELEMEAVIDNFVNKLNPLAAERPACDMKYMQILRKEITELLVELPLSYDSVMFKRKAHQLATEIVNLPRNIKLSGSTTSTSVFEENISEWVCEHGMCRELKKDPKLIEGLANKLKSQGIGDEEVIETMKELISEFVDDVDTAIGVLDEFIDELMKTFPSFVQKGNLYSEPTAERFDVDELHEMVTDWISNLPGASDFFSNKFEEITEDIVTMIHDSIKQGNEDLENNIFEYIADTGLPIDLGVLHTHVDELMERLNILPPSEDVIDQAKINMIKEMFKVIDASSMSEENQEELKRSALKLVQRKASMMSSLNFLEDQDDVKEALLSDMNRIMNKTLGEGQNEFKDNLRSSLSTTFDKSFVRIGKDESDLKQIVEKKVRKAIDVLPVDTIRKKDLMGQVNKILCKCMNQPLPPNVKNIINDNISNILDKCPISEDRSLCGRLKKTLFDVVGQHLDMLLPKPVCDFQCETEDDVGMVIDRCPIDPGTKTQLKKCIQDIFTKNGDRLLSEEAVRTIEEEIHGVCSDLPIPKDKKAILVKAVGASVSKNLKDALLSLRHDLIKVRKRLYVTMTNVIEKSPITRDVKTNLKSQIESVLVRNLDTSLSDKEKQNILDEVSIVLKDDMPEEKIKNLTNILSNKMDAFQRKEKTKDLAEMITKDVDQLVNSLPIDSYAKKDFRKDVKAVLLDTLYNPLTNDTQQKIKKDIINEIDDIDIPKNEKNYLKANVAHAVSKQLNELIAQGKEAPEIATSLEETIRNKIKDSTIPKDKQELLNHKLHDVLANNLVRDVTYEEKEEAKQKLSDIVDDLKIDKGKTEAVKTQLLNDAHKYFEIPARDRIQTKESIAAVDKNMSDNQRDYQIQNKILQSLENSIDDALIPEVKKIELKTKLKNIIAKNIKEPLSGDATELTQLALKDLENKTKQNIVRGLENVIAKAPIPKEEKKRLKEQLKNLATQQFKRRLSGDFAVGLKKDMDEIIDEMNLSKTEKDKLKSELAATVDDNISNLRNKTKPKQIEGFKELENETEGNIVRGLENVIDAAPIPKEKKIQLMKNLKDLTTQQFKRQLSDDVAKELKDGMVEIIDEMNLPKDTKVKLKSELTATVDDNMSDMHRKIKDADSSFSKTKLKQLEQETQTNIKRRIENVIDAASIPKEKKIQLMKKLKDLTTQQFKRQLSDDVAEELKDDMVEIIDEMNLPKDTKVKLKSELTATVDDNMSDMHRKIKGAYSNFSKQQSKELEQESQTNIERRLENVIDAAPTPKEKNIQLMKKLMDLTTQQFKSQLTDDVVDGLKDDMGEIIDEMNLPEDKKIKLKSELTAAVDDNMSNLKNKIKPSQQGIDELKALENETKGNIIRELENVVAVAPIPKEKKNELKKQFKDLATQQFKNNLSDDVVVGLRNDRDEIIDEINLPKGKKMKVKSELNATVDDNMSNLRSKTKPSQKGHFDLKALAKETEENMARELENVVDAAPIPKEKKIQLMKKLKNLTTQQFKSQLSDDAVEGLKDDMGEIIDEMDLPKDKKMKLKSELTATVDDNMSNLRTKTKSGEQGVDGSKSLENETKRNIVRELESVIDAAPITREKKNELKKQFKDLATQHFKNHLSDDVAVGLKDDMYEIIDEMNLPKDKKLKLKSELNAIVDDNMINFQSKTKPSQKGHVDLKALAKETEVNMARELENVVDAAPIPKEKKIQLMKKLKDLTTQQFKRQLSDDVAEELKDDMGEIIDEMNLPKDTKVKLKSELTATVDDNMSDMHRQIKDADSLKSKELEEEIQTNIKRRLENVIDAAPIPKEKKVELKKKLKDLAIQQFNTPLFDDDTAGLKDNMSEIIDNLNLPKDKERRLKSELNATVDEHNKSEKKRKIKDADSNLRRPGLLSTEENKKRDRILQGIEKVIEKSAIPENKKQKLSGVLQKIADDHLKKRFSNDMQDKDSIQDDDSTELKTKTQSNILLGQDKAKIPKELRKYLKNRLKELTKEHFMKPLTDDTTQELKDDIDKEIDDLNLTEHLKDQLKKELHEAVVENMRNLLKHLEDLKKNSKPIKDEGLKDIFDKFGIHPSYQKQLAEELNKLLDIARRGGDLEDARRKLIKKLMRDLNLPDEEASALADELINKARKMALKEQLRDLLDKYNIDPSYEDQMAEEFNKLLEIARQGGDLEDARRKLIKKLMRDLNQPEEKASAVADELIDKARKMALKEHLRDLLDKYNIDPSYEDQMAEEFNKLLEIARRGGDLDDAKEKLIKILTRDLNLSEAKASSLADDLIARAREMALSGKTTEAFTQAISDAVDQSTVPTADKPILKNRLLSKLKQILNKKPCIHKDDIGPLKEEVLKECNEIVDESSIPTDKKNELKQLLKEKLDKASDEDGAAESLADYKDKITEVIQKWMDSLPIHLNPKVAATVADNIASDIFHRHKYLHVHPEAKSSEKDEIENLKYQVFRQMYRVVNPKAMPKITERTPDLYKAIMKIKPPPQEPKRLPKPKDAFAKADRGTVDQKPLPLEEDPLAQKKMKELIKKFAKSVDQAIVESSLSKPDKSTIKKRLLEDLGITWSDRKKAEKYDVGPSDAMDKSPTAMEYKNKIRECVKNWLETLPIDIDPKTAATIADNLTNDILERQKYLRSLLETASTDEDEIENLMFQVFRRLKDTVDPERIPDILKRTEDLYNMIMNIKKELESRQEGSSSKRRRGPSHQDRKKSTSVALSTGNIIFSLRELIASTTAVRKQWSRNVEDAITKITHAQTDEILKDKLATNDEIGQIDMLSTVSRSNSRTSAYQGPSSTKQFEAKSVPMTKGKSRLSKIEEAFVLNNTTKQNSPFNPNKNQITEKDYEMVLNGIITNWLDKAKVKIAPKEKNEIVGKLVRDIVERQKHLQEYEHANSSRSDDLEFLKSQVHRRLDKLVPAGSLKTIVESTGELSAKIKHVQIPQTVAAMNKNVQIPPITPPKSAIKSPVSKRKKQNRNSQASIDTSAEEILNNKKTVDDDASKDEMSNTEFRPGQASTPNKRTGEEYEDTVIESTRSWIESVPINLEPDVQTEVINDLANDIIDRRKYLQVHPEKIISKKEEIENLRFQVFKRLDKVTEDESLIPDIDKIEELYKMINGDSRRKNLTPKEAQEFQTTLPDEIAAVLNDYNICCERRELLSSITKELVKLGNSNADQDEIIENLTDAIKRITYLSNCDMCDDEAEDLAYKLLARTKKLIARIQQSKGAPIKRRDFREAVMNDIGDVFHGCPMSADKRNMMECQLAEDYAEDLGIPLQDSEATMTGAGHYGMSFNGLTNFIDTWLSSIHTEDDDDTKEDSEINDKKKDMAYSLIHKIGEMNVDPEIFNDDALYEAILRDELQNMLGDITISEDELEFLKEEFINKVLEAKQRAHDEFAGQAYKRKLRDTISKVLPYQRNLSREEQATLNTLKDQLADAYIDLHFSGNNEPQREKLKRKISNELSGFCKDYINKVPCAPLSSKKLNQDLYAALNAVPLPAKDSIRYEVEQARIREEINDWLKELPIQPQNPTELLARNKMVYVLAKKLFDIEIEGNDTDNDSKRSEIVKFLNRLPLETEDYLETLADTLIDKLKETEESRKYNASSNVTLDSFGNVSMDPRVCSKHKSLFKKREVSPGPSGSQVVCGRPTCKHPKPMPPCTLSPEDKDYLERIRRRHCLSQGCVKSIMKDNKPKICPGVRSDDTGSQTKQKKRHAICQIADKTPPSPCSGQPADAYSQQRTPCDPQRAPVCPVSQQKTVGPCPRLLRASSQCNRQLRKPTISCANISDGDEEVEEVQPQITIKKYYWNPNDENARGNRDPSLHHQASPTRIRISSGAQCSPPPCGRPLSLCKLQQQDTGPQIRSDPKCQRKPSSSPYETVTQRSYQPFGAPSPCIGKRDNESRIPKRDGLDHQDQMPCSSYRHRPSRKERIIKLGSLDNLSNPRPEKRHNDANDWCFEDEEDDNFWCSPIRRVILDEGIDDSVVMEREQREERMRCNCKERLVPKSQAGRAQSGNFPSQQFTQGNDVGPNLKKCSKCCGRHCPYPSYLYFRQ